MLIIECHQSTLCLIEISAPGQSYVESIPMESLEEVITFRSCSNTTASSKLSYLQTVHVRYNVTGPGRCSRTKEVDPEIEADLLDLSKDRLMIKTKIRSV